jgi:hypothetical protein
MLVFQNPSFSRYSPSLSKMDFIGKYIGPSIVAYIDNFKKLFPSNWISFVSLNLTKDVMLWWKFLNYDKINTLLDEANK